MKDAHEFLNVRDNLELVIFFIYLYTRSSSHIFYLPCRLLLKKQSSLLLFSSGEMFLALKLPQIVAATVKIYDLKMCTYKIYKKS